MTRARWFRMAVRAVIRASEELPEFTADDVWDRIKTPPPPGVDGRTVGNAIAAVAKMGLVRGTGRHRPSRNPDYHKRPQAVWVACSWRPFGGI